MCGRFVLVTDLSIIEEAFDVRAVACGYEPGWNIAPGQPVPVIVRREDRNELISFRWGLIPSWAKDPSIGDRLINARAETVDQKPSFRNAFMKRRCLIVADGFYEWKTEGRRKIPAYFYLKSGRPFGFAGLYETWYAPDQTQVQTCTIITTEANSLIKPIHDRMPVIVTKDRESLWLDDRIEDNAVLMPILKPYPAEEMALRWGMGPRFMESSHRQAIDDIRI